MKTDPPEANSVEVSLFGPGKGECAAVYLGDDRWVIVDSCRDQRERVNPALSYLERLGVDVSKSVLLVVATHAHDDHFAGISEIFDACESAKFVCSAALTAPEFFALTDADERVHAGLPKRAYREYSRIFEIVESRGEGGFTPLLYAWEQKVLLSDAHGAYPMRVIALSPSNVAFTRAQRALASAIPKANESKRIEAIDPNELAIALWIEVAGKAILLGADLPPGPGGCGWQAVLATFAPASKGEVFKVSHHGSVTGHYDEVWTSLLDDSPLAMLTPFRGSSKLLPDSTDVDRIYSLTNKAYITASPQRPVVSRAMRKEAAAIGPLARNVRDPWGRCGQVRARSSVGRDDWTVECFAPARRL